MSTRPEEIGLPTLMPELQRHRERTALKRWIAVMGCALLLGACALERPLPEFTPPAQMSPSPTLTLPTPEPVSPAPPDAPITTPEAMNVPDDALSGRESVVEPAAVDVIWWGSQDNVRNHIGDSFLYSGFSDDSALVSAVRFDLSRIPRGAPITSAAIQMAGLREDRLVSENGGSWSLQLLSQDAVPDFRAADYQAITVAPAAANLLPTLFPADLSTGKINEWQFDPSARAWLQEQILNGATEAWVRIIGPTGGGDTLFAWDSGFGPATRGVRPKLMLTLEQPQDTPPPLPTEPLVVGTQPATPGNVFTAAANALTAAVDAAAGATPTPALRFLTATPIAQNVATAQAIAVFLDQPPVIAVTPPPANPATATFEAAFATAVAVANGHVHAHAGKRRHAVHRHPYPNARKRSDRRRATNGKPGA